MTGEEPAAPHLATSGPLASPGYWLHHAALAWRRELGLRLRDLELTPTQFDVLASLSWQSRRGPVTQQMVADFAGIDRMMTSKVVRGLEGRGLLTRSEHIEDARSLLLDLTDDGHDLVAAATRRARALDASLFADATASETLRTAVAPVLMRLEPSRMRPR
ncbi:MAG: MarR family transcriptional regulator [Acidobacteria bacterium]|nr:MarR family transcriptional regulator [Acidobacteriota bacterium]